MCGVSQAYISKLESGEANPTIGKIGAIFAAMWMEPTVGFEPLLPESSKTTPSEAEARQPESRAPAAPPAAPTGLTGRPGRNPGSNRHPPQQSQPRVDETVTIDRLKVPIQRLTTVCDPDTLGFETTAEIAPLAGTIGQERAVSALENGTRNRGRRVQRICVRSAGDRQEQRAEVAPGASSSHEAEPSGLGLHPQLPGPNSAHSHTPSVRHDAGLGSGYVSAGRDVSRRDPVAFESDDYAHRVEEVMGEIQAQRQSINEDLESQARMRGFTISSTQVGGYAGAAAFGGPPAD